MFLHDMQGMHTNVSQGINLQFIFLCIIFHYVLDCCADVQVWCTVLFCFFSLSEFLGSVRFAVAIAIVCDDS